MGKKATAGNKSDIIVAVVVVPVEAREGSRAGFASLWRRDSDNSDGRDDKRYEGGALHV